MLHKANALISSNARPARRREPATLGHAEPAEMLDTLAESDIEPWINERAFTYYPPLKRVKELVERHYDGNITLGLAARAAGLEKKYLSALFHKKVGIPFRSWVTWVRVREAMRLMQIEDTPLTSIAENVGFGDLRTFERSFKKLTGMTPREAKKAMAP